MAVNRVPLARHAVRRSRATAVLFLAIYPLTVAGVCTTGASLPMLIVSAGSTGAQSRDTFAQHLLCGSAAWTGTLLLLTRCCCCSRAARDGGGSRAQVSTRW